MVHNYLLDNVRIGSLYSAVTEDQLKRDKKLKKEVLRKYRITVNDKKLKPSFNRYKINIDFK